MNKIIINDEIKKTLTNDIEFEIEEGLIPQIKIKIKKDTDLNIEFLKQCKYKIIINILNNKALNLYEYKKGNNFKLQYKYYLEKNSTLNLYKINDTNNTKEMNIFNLNGEKAKVNYNFKTISTNEEKYDILVYHNKKETISNINNKALNLKDGIITFNVSSFVQNGIVDCVLNQNNRIVNLGKNTCTIKPNLFIEENDVIANHSALIGKFKEEEVFYLMSRGLSEKETYNLLIKGFLFDETIHKEKIDKMINKHWR